MSTTTASLNNLHATLLTALRLGRGALASKKALRQPKELLVLYEFEACPFCRKVREVLSEMDLEYIDHPCARGSRHRAQVLELGGKELFPFLLDANTGQKLYESEDIITHLMDTYGAGRPKLNRSLAPLATLGSGLASALRPRGRVVEPQAAGRAGPAQPLVLYSFEASPYCRKVREVLHELDLSFQVKNVAKGSDRRQDLLARGGKVQVPYLLDPNTGTAMYESDAIIAYLRKIYGGDGG